MKIITKYVLREHVGPLLFALSALTSLLLLNYIAKRFGELVGKGLPWQVILEFFVLSVPFTVAMTLPMAVLVSTLYAFSRLAAENEITALKASGISMPRLMRPVLVGASLIALIMLGFNDQILPRTNHRLRILQGDIARKKPTFLLREQVINDLAGGRYYLRANHISRDNHMREVVIYDLADPVRRRTIYADSGNMAMAPSGDLLMTLWDGYMQEIPKDEPTNLQRLFFHSDKIRIAGVANQLERSDDDSYKSDREMSVCEMQQEFTDHQVDLAVARHHMERALVAITREAATGVPGSITQEQQAPSVGFGPERPQPGKTIVPPGVRVVRKKGFVAYYCSGLRELKILSKQFARAATPAPAYAAVAFEQGAQGGGVQQGQDTIRRPTILRAQRADTGRPADTTQRRRDVMGQRADSMRRAVDSLAAAAAASRADTTLRPPGDSQLPTPLPAPIQPPVPGASADSALAGTPVVVPPVATPAQAPVANVQQIPISPAVVTATVEAAKSRMVENRREMNRYAVEIHKKFALSVACIVFVLIGAPIALRFPRGGVGLTIGVSLAVFGLYYVGLIGGESLADRDILPPFWAMWAANVILTATGLVLLARMGREAGSARGGDLSELLDLIRHRLAQRRAAASATRPA